MLEMSMTGIPNTQSKLKNMVQPEEVQRVLIRGGFKIEGEAKINCQQSGAVDRGRLMASVSTNWNDSGMTHGRVGEKAKASDGAGRPAKGDAMCVVRVATNVFYAPFVHWGTRNMPPRPFLERAAQSKMASIKKELDALFNKKGK